MKNVNFSPSARKKSSQGSWAKRILLGGALIALTTVVAFFWYKHGDIYQYWFLLNKVYHTGKADPKAVQVDSLSGEQQDGALPVESPSPGQDSVGDGQEGAGHEGIARKDVVQVKNTREDNSSIRDESGQESAVQEVKETKGTEYYIKVCSGVVKNEIEKAADRLTLMNYSPKIIGAHDAVMMENVYVASDSSSIHKTVDRLTNDGFAVYLKKDSKNQYTIRAGSCYYPESAKSLLKSLKHKGYSGNIIREETRVKTYSVFLGAYSHREAAMEEQRQLNGKGFPDAAVTTQIPASDE
ncbi:MAG: SPOR domain-containing protein [bacterium]